MLAEQKELYNFITSVEPWKSRYEERQNWIGSVVNPFQKIVRDAIEDYNVRYGNGDDDIFSHEDYLGVCERLTIETEHSPEYYSEFKDVCNDLVTNGICENDIYWNGEFEFEPRKAKGLEISGVIYSIYKFLKKLDPELTMEESYYMYSGQRDEGRFDLHENVPIYGCKDPAFEVSHFYVSGDIVIANIVNLDGDTVAEVRIEER